MNVFEALAHTAKQCSDHIAIIDAGGPLDYKSLWREVEGLRLQLDALGVRAQTGVGIRARNGRTFVIGALAALGCGAVIMPIHHQIKTEELSDMLTQAPLCAILDDGTSFIEPARTVPLSSPGGNGLRFTPLQDFRPLATGVPDAAFVRFTSGTTGTAKGVVLTHRDVLERTHAANSGLRLTGADRILWVLPMAYHFYVSIILYLEVGATIIVGADYLADSLLETAAKNSASFLYVTPMHIRLLNSDQSGRELPPSLKHVMSVSAQLHPASAREFLAKYKMPVCQGYGIIEVGLPIQNIAEAMEHPEAIGRPVEGFEAKIVNDSNNQLADGETGQLFLRGPGMFSGYLNRPQSRAEILQDGWFLTGDLAHRDSDGRIVLDGRSSFVIHVAGCKVFPEEVAAALDHHPAVLRSRVSALPHPQLGEAIHAEVQLRPGQMDTTPEDIITFSRRRLSSHKVPATLEIVSAINTTPSGKVRHGIA